MGFWLFGRKKQKSKSGIAPSPEMVSGKPRTASNAEYRAPWAVAPEQKLPSRYPAAQKGGGRGMPRRPKSPERPYLRSDSAEDITALPIARQFERSPHLRPVQMEPPVTKNTPVRSTSLVNVSDKLGGRPRPEALRSKRSMEQPSLLRRISGRSKRTEYTIREEEVKAMSPTMPTAIPKRYSQEPGAKPGDSKRIRSGTESPANDYGSSDSLQGQDSARSSRYGQSDHYRFNVGSLDIFNPRPTIRYSGPPTYASGAISASKTNLRRGKSMYNIGTIKEAKTVDELAEDLDSGSIRDAMERDRRRRDKKRRTDDEKAARKLQRMADKQKVQDRTEGTRSRPRASSRRREVTADTKPHTELPATAVEAKTTTSARPTQPVAGETELTNSEEPAGVLSGTGVSKDPFGGEAASQHSEGLDHNGHGHPFEEPVVQTAQAVRLSTASISPPASPTGPRHTRNASSISQKLSMPAPLKLIGSEPTEAGRQEPDASSPKLGGWGAIFRRGKGASDDHGRAQSTGSFSNTSRESMSRQVPPAHLTQRGSAGGDNTPVRTQSIFREHLPGAPVPPPDSRMQSPEVGEQEEIPLPAKSERRAQPVSTSHSPSSPFAPGSETFFADSPASSGIAAPERAALTQSLASVDSEASWLSGKPKKRGSQQTQPSIAEQQASRQSLDELPASEERHPTPPPESRHPISSTVTAAARGGSIGGPPAQAQPGQVEREEQIRLSGAARNPRIIYQESRVKSSEGQLNQFDSASHENSGDASLEDAEDVEDTGTVLERATSVSYQSHARQVSGGSAKLLDVPATPKRTLFPDQ